MSFSIVTLPTQSLREESKRVDPKGQEVRGMLKDLKKAMHEYQGVGIASCQVGINRRIFMISTENGVETFCNGKITGASLELVDDEEGCLSVPGVYGNVKRHAWVDFEYDDIKGRHKKIRATDFFARVIQHEVDHTNGILFVDKADSFTRGTPPAEPGKAA